MRENFTLRACPIKMKPAIRWRFWNFSLGIGFAKEKSTIQVDSGVGSLKVALLFPE